MPRKKDLQFLLRTDEHDANTIRQKIVSSGLSQQDYLLRAALEARITDPTPFLELLKEYKRQGNNLNQLTRYLNSNHHTDPYTAQLIKDLSEDRSKLWQLLSQCIQTLVSIQP